MNAESLFWSQVNLLGSCWEWRGRKLKKGYGQLNFARKEHLAHRLSYTLAYGPIPRGLFVLHCCDNPPCVNPAHLFLGTAKDNLDDARAKGRLPIGDKHYTRHRPQSEVRGEAHHNARLSDADVIEIRRLCRTGRHGIQVALAQHYGVSKALINRIHKGKARTYTE